MGLSEHRVPSNIQTFKMPSAGIPTLRPVARRRAGRNRLINSWMMPKSGPDSMHNMCIMAA